MSFAIEETAEVVLAFQEALEDLQRNDQYEIENLTMIAKEATEYAQAISQAVETHISKTRPEYKLPALYLLDSLVKHIGTPYTVYLGRTLSRTFFSAYAVVPDHIRRAMDELFRSWMKPVPESRDPRPVFPPSITTPMAATLSKMRGVDEQARNAAEHARTAHPMRMRAETTFPSGQSLDLNPHQLPQAQAPSQFHSAGSTSALVGNALPQYFAVAGSSAHAPTPSELPIQHGISHPRQGGPVQYVYTGPPPSTMSHQARLDKLKADVQGLMDTAHGYLARFPQDHEKAKLLQNLESLKILLESGTLSLTHIQSTEIVIANIARDLPSLAPPPLASPSGVDISLIASILGRNTPQPPRQDLVPPPSRTAAIPTPVFQQASPAPSSTVRSAVATHGLPGMTHSPGTSSTDALHFSSAGSSFLEQLRAAGILGAALNQEVPGKPPVAASILSQLMQPAASAVAGNDSTIESASLKSQRSHLVRQLYEDKTDQCRMCGMRFPGAEVGKKAKSVHIDWHFKVNTRVQESMKHAINRSWYMDEHDWTNYQEELDGYSGITMIVAAAAADSKSGSTGERPGAQFVFVPTDARLVNVPCSICLESFEQGWEEQTQQPIWKDAVKVGNKYYHGTCFAEVTKKAASSTPNAMERTASASARSTPDPVLGKRRFDEFRGDGSSR